MQRFKANKKTAWFFGDSFTDGYPLCWDWTKINKNDETESINYEIFKKGGGHEEWNEIQDKYSQEIWPKLFAKHLDYNYVNRGRGGMGNDIILNSIIAELERMRTGDFVVIGLSNNNRFALPTLDRRQYTSNIMVLQGDMENYNETQKKAILDYTKNVLDPNYEKLHDWWVGAFHNIKNYLQTIKGIDVFIWDATNFSRFETMKTWSNGKYDDRHWSPNGHKEFFDYLLSATDTGITSEFSDDYWYYE